MWRPRRWRPCTRSGETRGEAVRLKGALGFESKGRALTLNFHLLVTPGELLKMTLQPMGASMGHFLTTPLNPSRILPPPPIPPPHCHEHTGDEYFHSNELWGLGKITSLQLSLLKNDECSMKPSRVSSLP